MLWFELFVLFLAVMKCLPLEVVCNNLPDVYWNSSNPIFRIDNTDHIIDVNKGNIPFEYDQVNIICPVYTQDTTQDDAEKYIIYNVSKEEYDTCRITNPSPRVIAVCDKPYKLMYFTITFRSFTPQPGGLEFKPGQDYYFISTSSQDDLHRRIGGRCSTHHMKVVFKVCCDPASQPARDQANNHLPASGPATTRGTTTTTTTTSSTSTKPSTTTTTPKTTSTTSSTSTSSSTSTTSLKTTSHKASDRPGKTTQKKTDNRQPDRSQNEVVKNEELTLNSGPPSTSSTSASLLLISLLLAGLTLLHHHHHNNHHHSFHHHLHHHHHSHHNHRHTHSKKSHPQKIQSDVHRCFEPPPPPPLPYSLVAESEGGEITSADASVSSSAPHGGSEVLHFLSPS
ncbi:ephrin-B2-like [Eriocheir sinensis]|uniref:ephrin-B2-like n=1 Tax=Eriocheir sinensis TaxID=95602 RepID=UPI0021C78E6E|nr:ephrin-B2-like [Eriocheir sinensis]